MYQAARWVNPVGPIVVALFLTAASGALAHLRAHAAVPPAARRSDRSVESIYDVTLRPPILRKSGDTHLSAVVDSIQPRSQATKTLIVPRLEDMNVTMLGDSTLRYSFRSPSGRRFVPDGIYKGDGYTSGGAGQFRILVVQHPEPGNWSVTVDATASSASGFYAILINSNGAAEEQAHLETMVRDSDSRFNTSVEPGTPVYVRAFVLNGERPVPGVRWSVRADWIDDPTHDSLAVKTARESWQEIPVFDDGRHADGAAEDGIYVGILHTRASDGLYRVAAEGKTPGGVAYFKSDHVAVRAKYDLLITEEIVVSPDPRVGKPVTLTVTVKNDGPRDYRGARFELHVDKREKRGSQQMIDLKAGESRRVVTQWTPDNAGDHEVNLSIDAYIEPYEVDYANNARRATVKVR